MKGPKSLPLGKSCFHATPSTPSSCCVKIIKSKYQACCYSHTTILSQIKNSIAPKKLVDCHSNPKNSR